MIKNLKEIEKEIERLDLLYNCKIIEKEEYIKTLTYLSDCYKYQKHYNKMIKREKKEKKGRTK